MIIHRPHYTRANPKADWISSYRTFSFPPYYDPNYINFSNLQTINDDRVQPDGHVPLHEHKNMEIFGYVVEGICRHTDNHGNVLDIPAGSVQRMSAGSGIWHTEGNASDTPNRYLQLWIQPNEYDTESYHDWYQFTREEKFNQFCDITAKLPIKQDARLLAGIFTENFTFQINDKRKYYLYIISGSVIINNLPLIEGDGLSFIEEELIDIAPNIESEIILFDLV
jgi:redox-sensitive bicupin YhaK (pirin superfamily)